MLQDEEVTTDDLTGTGSARRATIRDVAALAGVSKSLVSLVFASPDSVGTKRRLRVLEAAEALGFRPNQAARSLASVTGGFFGVLVADLHNPVFADLLDAARLTLAERGGTALVTTASLPGGDGRGRLDVGGLQLFGDLRPNGLLVVGSVPDMGRISLIAPGRPIVLASSIAAGLDTAMTVRGDDETGIGLLVDHLVGLGHREIAHVGGHGGSVAELRATAYRDAMRRVGLGDRIRVERSGFTERDGREASQRLLRSASPPSAIVAVNDLAAIGAIEAAVAESATVAVTGYDNTFLAALGPISLTTVDPDSRKIGRLAAGLLLDPGARETLVPPRLVVRASTLGASRPGG